MPFGELKHLSYMDAMILETRRERNRIMRTITYAL